MRKFQFTYYLTVATPYRPYPSMIEHRRVLRGRHHRIIVVDDPGELVAAAAPGVAFDAVDCFLEVAQLREERTRLRLEDEKRVGLARAESVHGFYRIAIVGHRRMEGG